MISWHIAEGSFDIWRSISVSDITLLDFVLLSELSIGCVTLLSIFCEVVSGLREFFIEMFVVLG